MKRRKYYFEFVGQHTAGKTTIIRDIVDGDYLSPYVSIYPQLVTRSRGFFWLHLPILFFKNIPHLWFLLRFSLRYAKLNWINFHAVGRHLWKMIILHPYFERFDFDIWMKDDLLHLLPRIEFKNSTNSSVKSSFKLFFDHFKYLYDGIVYVDLPYDVMQERFFNRFKDRSRLRRASRTPVYERAFTQNILLKEILLEQEIVPVLVIRGTDSIDTNRESVVNFIKKYIK